VLVILVATIGGGLERHERSAIRIADIDIAAEALGIAEALLNVTTYLDNGGDAQSGDMTTKTGNKGEQWDGPLKPVCKSLIPLNHREQNEGAGDRHNFY